MFARLSGLALLISSFLAFAAGIAAIDSAYKNAPDSDLNLEDQALDAQIQEEVKKIEKLDSLRRLHSLHLSPQNTKINVSANGECLEVDAHAENHEMPRIKSAPVDYKIQRMQVCFTGGRLSRIESAFTTVSLRTNETSANKLVHENPAGVSANDIVLSRVMNKSASPPLRVGDLENSKVNPLRLSFKRDYYLPHLRNTLYNLQLTYDWHRRVEVKKNEKTVQQYINRAEN